MSPSEVTQAQLRALVLHSAQGAKKMHQADQSIVWSVSPESKCTFELHVGKGTQVHVRCVSSALVCDEHPKVLGSMVLGDFADNQALYGQIVSTLEQDNAIGYKGYPLYAPLVSQVLFGAEVGSPNALRQTQEALAQDEGAQQWIQALRENVHLERTPSGVMALSQAGRWQLQVDLSAQVQINRQGWLEIKHKEQPLRLGKLHVMIEYKNPVVRSKVKLTPGGWLERAHALSSCYFSLVRSGAQILQSAQFCAHVQKSMPGWHAELEPSVQSVGQLIDAIGTVEPAAASALQQFQMQQTVGASQSAPSVHAKKKHL